MNPYYQQPRPQVKYPPQQSRGFQPPQSAFPQPLSSGFVPSHQGYPQYQDQRPSPFQQQHPTRPPQQYVSQPRYSQSQSHPTPAHPTPAHPTPAQPLTASGPPSQAYYPLQPQPQQSAYASSSYQQPHPVPVRPPLRTNSQSPDKARRPLPEPAPPIVGVGPPRPNLSNGPSHPISSYRAHVRSPIPIFPGPNASYGSSQGSWSATPGPVVLQNFSQRDKPQVVLQSSSTPPRLPDTQPQSERSSPSPIHRYQTRSASPAKDISASKRPLPAPPGGIIASKDSPIVTPPPTTPSSQRRALPFSPTKPPSVEEGLKSRNRPILSTKRSSTLPAPSTNVSAAPFVSYNANRPVPAINGSSNTNSMSDTKDDVAPPDTPPTKTSNIPSNSNPQPSIRTAFASFSRHAETRSGHTETSPASAPTVPASAPAPQTPFALPPRKQQTQSLAFRLAALSLQEESHKSSSTNRYTPQSTIDLDDKPPAPSIRKPGLDTISNATSSTFHRMALPTISLPEDEDDDYSDTGTSPTLKAATPISTSTIPPINIQETPTIDVSNVPFNAPSISVSGPNDREVSQAPSITISEPTPTLTVSDSTPSITVSDSTPSITISDAIPVINVSGVSVPSSNSIPDIIVADLEGTLDTSVGAPARRRKGLICYECGEGILGRIVSAMGGRWHPSCFKCTVCSELLEHVSSYEHNGRPYCHLDYHEKFAPQCYHCRTPIVDERFITLNDPGLGKRTYHEQHFFCAECGDPFLAPRIQQGGRNGNEDEEELDVVTQEDDVGFTVYKGHPYCEACHVRLRYPKCKRCKKSIRDGMQAVEALGGKWCWECFLCGSCEKPFEDPAFFQRNNKPYCEPCFSLIIKNEI